MAKGWISCTCMMTRASSRPSSAPCRSSFSPTTPHSFGVTTSISRETWRSPSRWNNQAPGVAPAGGGGSFSFLNLRGDVRGLQIRLEAIARAAHRLDQLVMTGRRKRLAQPADMHIHRTLLDEHVLAPYLVQQPRPREHAPRMGHEEVKKAQLRGPEVDRLVARGDLVRGRVDAQAGDLDHVV